MFVAGLATGFHQSDAAAVDALERGRVDEGAVTCAGVSGAVVGRANPGELVAIDAGVRERVTWSRFGVRSTRGSISSRRR